LNKTKQRLGKGLGALLPDFDKSKPDRKPEEAKNLRYIDPRLIKTNPLQPRSDFNSNAMDELKQSIEENGLIQPLIVRINNDQYELIAGERRLRSVLDLGYSEVPVFIKDVETDQGMLELALIENIQREDLNVIELAKSYQRLIVECELTIEQLAKRLGKERSTINNIIRLLKLPEKIQGMLQDALLSGGHARALLSLDNKSDQIEMAEKIIKQSLSVRQVEQLVKNKPAKAIEKKAVKDLHLMDLEKKLMEQLGTKVSVSPKKKGGLIEVHYYTDEDLERITELIDKLS
jgi:ParB family transcriptional regulator, chromosome partitioning protein